VVKHADIPKFHRVPVAHKRGTWGAPGHYPHMPDNKTAPTDAPLLAHGAEQLPLVTVDAYNAEMRSTDGFVGARASKRAFQAILDDWRERVRKVGADPFGEIP